MDNAWHLNYLILMYAYSNSTLVLFWSFMQFCFKRAPNSNPYSSHTHLSLSLSCREHGFEIMSPSDVHTCRRHSTSRHHGAPSSHPQVVLVYISPTSCRKWEGPQHRRNPQRQSLPPTLWLLEHKCGYQRQRL